MCDRGLEYIWIRCEMPRLEKEAAAGKARSAIALFGGAKPFLGGQARSEGARLPGRAEPSLGLVELVSNLRRERI